MCLFHGPDVNWLFRNSVMFFAGPNKMRSERKWLALKSGLTQLKVCMDEPVYVKIACPSCSEHVEFPMEMRGDVINCPHCTLSMVLELPGAPQTPPPGNLYQRLRALNGLDAKPVNINPPEAFMQNPQARR
jgi:hypothetical protein